MNMSSSFLSIKRNKSVIICNVEEHSNVFNEGYVWITGQKNAKWYESQNYTI
ncbi:hypothetical protein J31TS6_59600 [Brevibacillus reuszeri]|nr:hypothetical protein J31TS6_59600 [Brevibacillus reuszeri]